MKKQSFAFEIQDLITQFLAAFNNVVIDRFEGRNRVSGQKIQVKYVYAPKQRVLYDLINPAQNLILPVVAISIANITRDDNRVFSKSSGMLTPSTVVDEKILRETPYFKTPVPINITLNMSILCKNQLDMDQILGNFIPYNNPYIIISWKIPTAFTPNYVQEIRTEVLWDGNIAINYPVEINNTQKAQIIADTTFTIKGWLFPFVDKQIKNIYKIDVNLYSVNTNTVLDYVNYFSLSSLGITVNNNNIEYSNTISVSSHPILTGLKHNLEEDVDF
jgi:hypothetical protein